MDLGVIVGIPIGFAVIIGGILFGGYSLATYVDIPSVLITIVGSFGAMLVATPVERMKKAWTIFQVALRKQTTNIDSLIPMLVTFSEKSRREGLLSLEDDIESVEDEFFRAGIQLVVDGTDPDVIKSILYNEMNQIASRHENGIYLFSNWGVLAPAWGMIGTLFGLVGMLNSLGDQSGIGAGMAAALITTFYGAILANLILLPIKDKLTERNATEVLSKEIIIEGILSIQTGDNPRIVEQKLLAFLEPNIRGKVKQTE